jgi:hypothetical protein
MKFTRMKFTGRREGGEEGRKEENLPSSHPPGEYFFAA